MIVREIAVLSAILTCALAKPKEESRKNRAYHKEASDKEHFENEHHNSEYDHRVFLDEEAKTFDQLPPEESKRRLGIIVDKIDFNNDGFISREELKDWISFTQKRYVIEDVDRQWKDHNPENNLTISWENYQKLVYGFLDSMDSSEAEKDNEGFSFKSMLRRDRRRWSTADRDGDDNLTKEEFAGFLYREETEYMRDIVILETIEDMDKDKDGKISLQEYIDKYYGDENEESDWVKSEREHFTTYYDKDGDGFMDEEAVKNLILPQDFYRERAETEASRLIYEADSDADEQLTKEEVLKKYCLFVGSHATDFGEALARHDEF